MSGGRRLLRTIRLDPSDGFVFGRAAEPGEWAVPGSFMFWGGDPARLEGKARAAFRSGFLGVSSFGWSTLAVVVEASPAEVEAAALELAGALRRELGAPSPEAALPAAREELAYAAGLAEAPGVGTLVALAREVEAGGAVRERFRTLRPRAGATSHERAAFAFLEATGEAEDVAPGEGIDLAGLAAAAAAGRGPGA